ncbi:hypothetical protein P7C73_g6292, partial [Tremellales sp. Uapishka_1]
MNAPSKGTVVNMQPPKVPPAVVVSSNPAIRRHCGSPTPSDNDNDDNDNLDDHDDPSTYQYLSAYSADVQLAKDLDLNSREDFAPYKPNPFSMAKMRNKGSVANGRWISGVQSKKSSPFHATSRSTKPLAMAKPSPPAVPVKEQPSTNRKDWGPLRGPRGGPPSGNAVFLKRKAPALKAKATSKETVVGEEATIQVKKKAEPKKRQPKKKKDEQDAISFGKIPKGASPTDDFPIVQGLERQKALPKRQKAAPKKKATAGKGKKKAKSPSPAPPLADSPIHKPITSSEIDRLLMGVVPEEKQASSSNSHPVPRTRAPIVVLSSPVPAEPSGMERKKRTESPPLFSLLDQVRVMVQEPDHAAMFSPFEKQAVNPPFRNQLDMSLGSSEIPSSPLRYKSNYAVKEAPPQVADTVLHHPRPRSWDEKEKFAALKAMQGEKSFVESLREAKEYDNHDDIIPLGEDRGWRLEKGKAKEVYVVDDEDDYGNDTQPTRRFIPSKRSTFQPTPFIRPTPAEPPSTSSPPPIFSTLSSRNPKKPRYATATPTSRPTQKSITDRYDISKRPLFPHSILRRPAPPSTPLPPVREARGFLFKPTPLTQQQQQQQFSSSPKLRIQTIRGSQYGPTGTASRGHVFSPYQREEKQETRRYSSIDTTSGQRNSDYSRLQGNNQRPDLINDRTRGVSASIQYPRYAPALGAHAPSPDDDDSWEEAWKRSNRIKLPSQQEIKPTNRIEKYRYEKPVEDMEEIDE